MFKKTRFFEQASGFFGERNGRGGKSEASSQRIAPIGLTKDEVTLLVSMMSIVAIRTQREWHIGTVDDSQVFFVNIDSKEGAYFLRRHQGQLPIIQYGRNCSSGLSKPLRARELLGAFKDLDGQRGAEFKQLA